MKVSGKNTEQAVEDNRQEDVLQLGGWVGANNSLPQKASIL
jgi:hypothetical protein